MGGRPQLHILVKLLLLDPAKGLCRLPQPLNFNPELLSTWKPLVLRDVNHGGFWRLVPAGIQTASLLPFTLTITVFWTLCLMLHGVMPSSGSNLRFFTKVLGVWMTTVGFHPRRGGPLFNLHVFEVSPTFSSSLSASCLCKFFSIFPPQSYPPFAPLLLPVRLLPAFLFDHSSHQEACCSPLVARFTSVLWAHASSRLPCSRCAKSVNTSQSQEEKRKNLKNIQILNLVPVKTIECPKKKEQGKNEGCKMNTDDRCHFCHNQMLTIPGINSLITHELCYKFIKKMKLFSEAAWTGWRILMPPYDLVL